MCDDDANISTAVDVYAFGMILYELLTRQIPWKTLNHTQIVTKVFLKKER